MIISNDGKIILCTPTKVGSTSLERVILDDYKVGRRLYSDEAAGEGKKNSRGYKHGSICNLNVRHRAILVRHPLERFASIYAFLAKSKGSFDNTLVSLARQNKLVTYCAAYLVSKETVWTKQLSSYVNEFKPTKIYKLEDRGIDEISKLFGVYLSDVPHINKTIHGGWDNMKEKLPKNMRNNIEKLHFESIKLFSY